jgi:hypothetical protein
VDLRVRRRSLAGAALAVADGARRRRLVAPLGVVGALVLVVGIISIPGSSKGASQASSGAGVATVQRRDLIATDTESGTLSYATPATVYNRMTGTVTWLPSIGQVVKPGQTLYKVDNQPVVLFDGTTPAYRDLSSSDSAGPDIRELNQNLVRLGFDPNHQITVNDTWQSGTTAAVQRWQATAGESQTGTITLGQVVFLPGPQRVTAVNTVLGSNGSPASAGAASGATSGSGSAGSGGTGSTGGSGGGGGTGSAGASAGSGGSGSTGSTGASSGSGGTSTATKTGTASTAPRTEFVSLTTSSAAGRTEYVGLARDSGTANTGTANTGTANTGTATTGNVATRTAQSSAATCPTPKKQHSPPAPGSQPNCKQQGAPTTGTGGSRNSKQTNRQLQALLALLKAETAELGKSRSSSGGASGPPSGSSAGGSGGRTAGGTGSSAPSGSRTGAGGGASAPSSSSVGSSVSGGTGSASAGGVTASGAGGGSTPQAILQTTSTQLVVTVNLDATKQSEAVVGEPVTVQLPDGSTVGGRVVVVSPVAQTSTSSGAGGASTSTSSTIPVTIALATHRRLTGLDQAAVSVNFEQQVKRNVLSVPVTALIATAGGGYAVQEAAAPHRLIPVTPGLFAAGYVQISSSQIYPGLQVTDSQG